jgi:acetolactate synthase I/II/III large subunit
VIDIIAVQNHHYMRQATLKNTAAMQCNVWADGQIKQTKSAPATAFPKDEAWGPAAVADNCRDELPSDTLATVDSGTRRIC